MIDMFDVAYAKDNTLQFKSNISERIKKLIMTIDDEFGDRKLKHNLSRTFDSFNKLLFDVSDKLRVINMSYKYAALLNISMY